MKLSCCSGHWKKCKVTLWPHWWVEPWTFLFLAGRITYTSKCLVRFSRLCCISDIVTTKSDCVQRFIPTVHTYACPNKTDLATCPCSQFRWLESQTKGIHSWRRDDSQKLAGDSRKSQLLILLGRRRSCVLGPWLWRRGTMGVGGMYQLDFVIV